MPITCLYEDDFSNPEYGVHFHTYNIAYPEMHDHNYWEFFITLSGQIRHKTLFSTEKLSKNMGGLVHPRDRHCFLSADVPSTQLNVMITDELFKKMLSMVDPGIYDALNSVDQPISYTLSDQSMEGITNIVNTLQTINHTDNESFFGLLRVLWMMLIQIIYLDHIRVRHKYPQWLVEFVQKINLPENMNKKVAELAQFTPFSYAHLTRLFKQYTGDTLRDYTAKIRINYATMLLRTTDFSVLDVSGIVGYDSISHFIKRFKQLMGVTPMHYRNHHEAHVDLQKIILENNLETSKFID